MATETPQVLVPPNEVKHEYPVIDTDPHFLRVIRYARPSDYAVGAATAAAGPAALLTMERFSPTYLPINSFRGVMRLTIGIGLCAGFLRFYMRPSLRFFGWSENAREVEMDMKEMVEKVKKGEPLYGESTLSPYMQGVATRNSRYSQIFLHAMPWFNLVNHNQHGVDTAKYYKAAEEELERERLKKAGY
ncbi:NADH-ubiquinone oxidoreductase [Terfezia boudieri ATCC MYA-4762]|uniref:NADH-ubiquinone oxidoreductase n=1 Tax=Terfezia boudieri ATCC MYA-4762 TaxID=1051890 RepID=A0A3N4LKR9_9PEZI|nr:NADH-ubiquinone oxidoreductase [Terfezia boudieri ATCC MYA-4762]